MVRSGTRPEADRPSTTRGRTDVTTRSPDQTRRPRIPVLVAVGVLSVALVLGSVSAAPAEAAPFGSGCTVEAASPAPVRLNDFGKKVTHGRATVACPVASTVEVQYALYGEDPLSDDVVQRVRTEPVNLVDRRAYNVPRRSMDNPNDNYVDYQPSCNEDSPGRDELYSRARARIVTNGVASAWSPWDKGRTLSYDCG